MIELKKYTDTANEIVKMKEAVNLACKNSEISFNDWFDLPDMYKNISSWSLITELEMDTGEFEKYRNVDLWQEVENIIDSLVFISGMNFGDRTLKDWISIFYFLRTKDPESEQTEIIQHLTIILDYMYVNNTIGFINYW